MPPASRIRVACCCWRACIAISGEFEKLRALEPKLRGARGIRPAAVDELMDQAYLEMLRVAADSGDPERLERAWNDASKPATRRPDIVLAYARGAMKCRDHETAEKVLRDFLDDEWNDALAAAYGELELPEPLEPLGRRRKVAALAARGSGAAGDLRPAVAFAQSFMARRAAISRPASLSGGDPVTYQMLGNLLDLLGEKERAARGVARRAGICDRPPGEAAQDQATALSGARRQRRRAALKLPRSSAGLIQPPHLGERIRGVFKRIEVQARNVETARRVPRD